jgi:ribulose 1,5-bisphosphate synthetase/thiazole synthase
MKRRDLIKFFSAAPLLSSTGLIKASADLSDQARTDQYDLIVYGATPGGIACAVRAAREGLRVLLVNPHEHLGGMFSSGLGIMDTLYNGSRAPIYDEFRQSIYDFYRLKYGTDSPQYQNAGPGISKTKYEAHVAEKLVNALLAAETNISILKSYYPTEIEKEGRKITGIVFQSMNGSDQKNVRGNVVADCSYEADLVVVAGVSHTMGREAKSMFDEKYAGVIYTEDVKPGQGTYNLSSGDTKLISQLNLYRYQQTSTIVFMPESTGEADAAIQAFNLRAIITDDPDNRVLPAKPGHYDAAYFAKKYTHKAEKLTLSRPNNKSSMNYPKLIGLQNEYVEGSWEKRKKIVQQFYDELLGLLYFRQNDPSLDPVIRDHWRRYGLAKDEFADNNHLPYELYVRESRRIKGKKIFTQHDAQLAPGLKRAPIHPDSICITEWFLDSHACTSKQLKGSKAEGEVMLKSETVPGQVPFAAIFPQEYDNMLVPVCLSASHIGWGAIRLEPVWMHIGEVAGYVAADLVRKQITVQQVDSESLSRKLAAKRFMLTFFNDVEGRENADWYPAVQYLGTKGFFGSYEAQPNRPITKILGGQWASHLHAWKSTGDWQADIQARKALLAEETDDEGLNAGHFYAMISKALRINAPVTSLLKSLDIQHKAMLSKGDAARIIFRLLNM